VSLQHPAGFADLKQELHSFECLKNISQNIKTQVDVDHHPSSSLLFYR
jgi:hypothetical protein